jgi:hypothetical protein
MDDLHSELEHLGSAIGRGSRPIAVPKQFSGAATYHPAAGAFMRGFVPPHEMIAASVQDQPDFFTQVRA